MSCATKTDMETGHSSLTLQETFRESVVDAATVVAPTTAASTGAVSSYAPTSRIPTSPHTSPDRPLKRSRDAADAFPYSDSDSNSLSESESDSSSSPPKRQKHLDEVETPDSTPEPMLPPKKELRFHPATVDNSLWADLCESKYKPERPPTPYYLESPSSEWFNATESASCEPSSSTMPDCLAMTALHPTNSYTRVGLSIPLKPKKSRRVLSRNRAKYFLAKATWNNGFDFDADVTSINPHYVEDDTSSVLTDANGSTDELRDDCDDISVARSSPPPSVRIKAMRLPDEEVGDELAAMESDREMSSTMELPSIYMRPSRSMREVHEGIALMKPMGGGKKPNKPRLPTTEEVSNHAQALANAFMKLPSEDARAGKEALVVIARYQKMRSFEAGYREGLQAAQNSQTRTPEMT